MISPEKKKILEDLGKTQYGQVLLEYLHEELESIIDVRNAKSWDEAVGNQKAVEVLEKLFGFIQEKKIVTRSKTRYD